MTMHEYQEHPIFQQALAEVRAARETSAHRSHRWAVVLGDVVLVVALIAMLLIGYGLVDNRWYRIVAVEGGSMSPTLVNGDAIVLTRPPAELEVGMIVTLEVDGSVVTHRVVDVGDDGTFTTKGDANSVVDDWGDLDVAVVGVQRARIPFLGRVLTAVSAVAGSNAWQVDRVAIGGSVGGTACFGECSDDSDETTRDPAPTVEEAESTDIGTSEPDMGAATSVESTDGDPSGDGNDGVGSEPPDSPEAEDVPVELGAAPGDGVGPAGGADEPSDEPNVPIEDGEYTAEESDEAPSGPPEEEPAP